MSSPRDERGAMAVFLALMICVLLLPIAAIGVDLGTQRVARRDMQSLADAVALDLARQLDGTRTAADLQPTLQTLADQSLERNEDASAFTGDATVTPELGTIDSSRFGTSDYFTPLPAGSTTVPTAVRVRASTTVDFSFVSATGGANRSAIGTSSSSACFRLGSYGLGLDTSNSVLLKGLVEDALGGGVNLSALSYQGLAAADLSLLDLATQLGVGTVDELVALPGLTAGNLFVAAANVLQQDGDAANAAVLGVLATQVGALPPFTLGTLVGLSSGGGAAETATINVLDLVAGTAFVANGSNALAIPNLATNLGLTGTSLSSSIALTQRPQLACGAVGATTAATSQVNATITGTLASVPSLPTSLLGIDASVNAGSTRIDLNLASANGSLTRIVCGEATPSSPEGVDVSVTSQLATLDLQQNVAVSGTLGSGVLGGLLGGLLGSIFRIEVTGGVQLTVSTAPGAATRTANVRIPNAPTAYTFPVSTGSGTLGLDAATVVATPTLTLTARNFLGFNVSLSANQILSLTSGITSALVSSVANPLITAINTTLVTPLTGLLGIDVAGADVFGVPRPQCSKPSLAG